jgi:hypothetical protein
LRKRLKVLVLPAVVSLIALSASSASAAVEFGDRCEATDFVSEYTLTTIRSADASLPLLAPSAGVVTRVTSSVMPEEALPFSVPTTIKVLHSVGENTFDVTAQGSLQVGPGKSTVETRLPVVAGDRLGLRGNPTSSEGSPVPPLSYYCEDSNAAHMLGAFPGNAVPGSSASFEEVTSGGVPLVAVLEPDADNDGYGDETQDKCPQNVVVQVACPVVTLDSLGLAGKRAVTVYVTSSLEVPVTVSGTVRLGKGKTASLSAGPAPVPPGRFVAFSLKLPKVVQARLKKLSSKRKLNLSITASAVNFAGQVSTDSTVATLRGQAKPKPKGGSKRKPQK